MVEVLNCENIKEFINDKVLVVAYTKWCPICKMLLMRLEEISEIFPSIKYGKFDVSVNKTIYENIQAPNVPSIFLFKEGKIIDKIEGMIDFDEFDEILESFK